MDTRTGTWTATGSWTVTYTATETKTAAGMFGQSAQISSSFGLDDCIEIVFGILCKSQSLD